jgi:hypothetical protein
LSEPYSDEETFVEYLAETIGKIAKGLEPSEISSVLRDNVLIAAPKSNGDVRPFGIGFLYRKLAGTCLMHISV